MGSFGAGRPGPPAALAAPRSGNDTPDSAAAADTPLPGVRAAPASLSRPERTWRRSRLQRHAAAPAAARLAAAFHGDSDSESPLHGESDSDSESPFHGESESAGPPGTMDSPSICWVVVEFLLVAEVLLGSMSPATTDSHSHSFAHLVPTSAHCTAPGKKSFQRFENICRV